MANLKPCPFCGSEAHIYQSPVVGGYAPCCNNDECEVYWQREYGTEEQAIKAWNNRAERTCHLETNCYTCSRCSECGYHVWHVYNYCPNCGARVVEQ